MGKFVESPRYRSEALFEELFSREKVDLHVNFDLEIISNEVQEQPVQPVLETQPAQPVVETQRRVTIIQAPEKPKRAPYSGVGPRAYHISKNKKGEWQIKAVGADKPLLAFKDFDKMVGFSKVLADKNGATVRLHDEKGAISTLY